jgi:geranylgeranyl reductase family protein
MTETIYDADVLIVGGGPSGSICAYYLSKVGKKVILIDSENFPRDKICGDFVSPVGLKELLEIGIWELEDFERTNVITYATVYLNGVPLISKNLPDMEGLPNYGRVIPRVILDNWIVEAARKEGVQIITPCKLENYFVNSDSVSIDCDYEGHKRHFTVKLIVGADGSYSKVARLLNGRNPLPENKIVAVRAYFENINCISQQAELFFSSKSFPGYYWFFPTSPTTANVGVGMMLENFPKEEISLKNSLLEIIENDVSFKARIGNGKLVDKIAGFPLSIYNPNATIVKERLLLVGDAAGLVNPINGEGIQHAIQSGRWAAESIIECLTLNNFSAQSLKSYETKVKREIGYDMSISFVVMQFIRNRNLNPLWLKLLTIMIEQAKQDEKYADIAGGILAGMVPTSRAINFYFIRKSIYRGLIYPFKGPTGFLNFLKNSLIFGSTSIIKSFRQRKDYWNWLKSILKSSLASIKLYSKIEKQKQKISKQYNSKFFKFETKKS